MTDTNAKAVGTGIAGSAITAALLDLLIAKGVIDADDGRRVLEDALTRAAMHTGTWEGHEACMLIGGMLETKFPAAGNDG
jgi:polyhydroxyalkanoate synthesis regulator phasin